MIRRPAVVLALLTCFRPTVSRGQETATVPDKAYPIVLHSVSHVGDKYNDTLKVSTTTTGNVTAGGKVIREGTATHVTELSGVLEVTAVSQHGGATGTTMIVERFVNIDGDKTTALLEKGDVLLMT